MSRSIWETFVSLFRRSSGDDESEESFVPSPLDLSVRISHGGSDAEVDRELHEISERARELEGGRREE